MDLSKFRALDTIDVTIRHASFEDNAPVFTLAGPNHAATKKADQERSDAIQAGRAKTDASKVVLNHLAGRVVGWQNVTWEGEPMECTPENVVKILSAPGLGFVLNQIAFALRSDDAFFVA